METATQSRLRAIDVGRGLAVFLMIMVHTLWMYADEPTQAESLLGHVIHFIGKGSAAFLMCMGVSMVLSRNQSLRAALIRAVLLIAVGTGMNILKFVVPIAVLGTMPEKFIAAYGWESPLTFAQLRWLALTGDILQLAGLSFFFVALTKRYVPNRYAILAIALLIALVSRELSGLRIEVPGLYYLSELLFGGTYHAYFPVFPWMSFIFIGLFIGLSFKQTERSPREVFGQALYMGVPLLIVGGGVCLLYPDYNFGNFFHLGPGGVLYLAGINLVLLWLINRLVKQDTDNAVTRFLEYLSRRVTTLYVIQWTLICWGMGLIGYQTLNALQTLAMMPVMIALSLATQHGMELLIRLCKSRGKNGSRHRPVEASEVTH